MQKVEADIFSFFLSGRLEVCDWRCRGAAAALHPLSPHGGRVVFTKQSAVVLSVDEHHIHTQRFPRASQMPTLPRARGSEEKLHGSTLERGNVPLEK